MKGIILAGGTGSRMWPMTAVLSKQMLPIYDKPLIYYPLSTLILAGITEILIITKPNELELFQKVLGSGEKWGIQLSYAIQEEPNGIPDAFIIGEQFIDGDSVCLILGDNILYGAGLASILSCSAKLTSGAQIFAYPVRDPERYGVVSFDGNSSKVLSLDEKPQNPKSNYAVIGVYFYDKNVVKYSKNLKPSERGELEIMDLNQIYLDNDQLTVRQMGRGMAWLDTGTPESMLEASQFIQILEVRQGTKISCPEEIAWRTHLINDAQLLELANQVPNSSYCKYLKSLLPGES